MASLVRSISHARRSPSTSSFSVEPSDRDPDREQPARKRRRVSDVETAGIGESADHSGTSTASSNSTSNPVAHDRGVEPIEQIDLTEVEGSAALAKALAKQREDAVRAQESLHQGTGRSILTSYKCPVCMDTPVDATSTVCGHLFCHKCIMDTLKFSEEQRSDASGKGPRGTCPVCRKPLARTDAPVPRRNLVPLQLKLATKRRNQATTEGT
ncbi:hypothetical protein IFM53868_00468 [Aspergillus udagawae]|uniref:RING-type domain-containing protein n=1 Tax=Aspergillus udagawae TaxID=91492 RepID=A0ABQ1A150_9EURO|nr:hypothetical protein IFM53868_00468 [Aspergillus udagawae]